MTNELDTALAAVSLASGACREVQRQMVFGHTLAKQDRSPVTVADFASQALVCAVLGDQFPGDAIVGEEDSAALRQPEQEHLCRAVVEHVSRALGRPVDPHQVLDWIDRGGSHGTTDRYWTLDPIDGTKGFLRAGQYAVALALIESGQAVLGVLGCPNFPPKVSPEAAKSQVVGRLVGAAAGQGVRAMALGGQWSQGVPLRVNAITEPAAARICGSVEAEHSDRDAGAAIAARLGITAEPLRMDSQVKYAVLAAGEAEIYMRLPTRPGYRECIWDHAAGLVVIEQAGGRVTDIAGRRLDFTHGRRFERNRGILATSGTIHDAVLAAIAAQSG